MRLLLAVYNILVKEQLGVFVFRTSSVKSFQSKQTFEMVQVLNVVLFQCMSSPVWELTSQVLQTGV